MKSYCFAFLLCLLSVIVKAQQQTVSIGTNDTKHHVVLYLHSPAGNQGLIIPMVTDRNSMLAGAATQAGMIVFEAETKTLYYNNGSEWIAVGSGTTVYSSGDGIVINTSNKISVDVGITANKIVQLDGSGRLPAVDGSQLTNLPTNSGDIPKSLRVPVLPVVLHPA